MDNIFAYLLIVLFALAINYFIIRIAVKNATKEALKQSEYYLEIIAKYYHENKK